MTQWILASWMCISHFCSLFLWLAVRRTRCLPVDFGHHFLVSICFCCWSNWTILGLPRCAGCRCGMCRRSWRLWRSTQMWFTWKLGRTFSRSRCSEGAFICAFPRDVYQRWKNTWKNKKTSPCLFHRKIMMIMTCWMSDLRLLHVWFDGMGGKQVADRCFFRDFYRPITRELLTELPHVGRSKDLLFFHGPKPDFCWMSILGRVCGVPPGCPFLSNRWLKFIWNRLLTFPKMVSSNMFKITLIMVQGKKQKNMIQYNFLVPTKMLPCIIITGHYFAPGSSVWDHPGF